MEEREAIARLKEGDVGGLEVLAKAHYTRAARAAYLILRDREAAEDTVQAALVKAYEGIGGFDANRPFGPWFMKIVVNDAVKTASRRERTVLLYKDDAPDLLSRLADPGSGPHEHAERRETQRKVWAALAQLPPAQRAAVVQRYYLGMSEAEMAREGASPPGTIKSRLSAARRRLSGLLRPESREAETPRDRLLPTSALRASAQRRSHE